jgi:hypothetical protein
MIVMGNFSFLSLINVEPLFSIENKSSWGSIPELLNKAFVRLNPSGIKSASKKMCSFVPAVLKLFRNIKKTISQQIDSSCSNELIQAEPVSN